MSSYLRSGATLLLLSAFAVPAFAAESESQGRKIEEVIVTAQRTSESIQDVPIAVTALTGEMLEERGVVTPSDLQMSSPNLSYTPTNFGGYSFSIRGIGNLVIGGESGVSTHVNEIPIASQMSAIEFYDMERVEVLRGPQGTLFGRNATGGAVNFVTRQPDFDSVNGFLDVEGGDYNNWRFKGAVNFPIADTFAVRLAGMKLDRDGFIKNTAYGQVADNGPGAGVDTIDGINKDLDGRDITSFRATAAWDITDQANLWVMYSYFKEDDDRARITNQICNTSSVATLGCIPDGKVVFGSPNAYVGTGGLIWGFGNAYASSGFVPTVTQKYNVGPNDTGFRKMHTDFEPVYKENEDILAFGFKYDFDNIQFGLTGAYQWRDYVYQQDYLMDTGNLLYDGAFNFPVSAPAGKAGDDWRPGPCNYNDGTSGALAASNPIGGCTLEGIDGSVNFVYDQADSNIKYWTIEGKMQSSFEGKFNFVLGANAYKGKAYGDYYVFANSLDVAGSYPGFFDNTSDPDQPGISKGWAIFGEGYYDITDKLKFTLGLRYNEDTRESYSTSVLFNSFDLNGADYFDGALGQTTFARTSLGGWIFGGPATEDNVALLELYGVTQGQIDAATTTEQRVALATQVPPVPQAAETRALTGSPTSFKFKEWSGRVGFDWVVGDDSMIYAFYSRGYKPGGLNPAIPTDFQSTSKFSFDPEKIDAFEVGTKNTFMDGSMVVNGAVFYYDYKGLQVSRIANNTSLNDNIDAKIWGVEAEMFWRPDALPGLGVDLAYSYTHTKVVNSFSVDPTNRTADNPDWRTLNNIDSGATIGVNFVAEEAGLTPLVVGTCGLPLGPGLDYPDGTPAVFSRSCLSDVFGVNTSDGLETDLDGKELPNTPKHNIKLGLDYTWDIPAIAGSLMARWDYYWQSKSYAREFNTVADEIDAWDQHNASLIYTSNDGHWQGRLFIRNIADANNVTGHYLTSDTSGFYRNYFLTEPRIYGASVRYQFGQ